MCAYAIYKKNVHQCVIAYIHVTPAYTKMLEPMKYESPNSFSVKTRVVMHKRYICDLRSLSGFALEFILFIHPYCSTSDNKVYNCDTCNFFLNPRAVEPMPTLNNEIARDLRVKGMLCYK